MILLRQDSLDQPNVDVTVNWHFRLGGGDNEDESKPLAKKRKNNKPRATTHTHTADFVLEAGQ